MEPSLWMFFIIITIIDLYIYRWYIISINDISFMDISFMDIVIFIYSGGEFYAKKGFY
ncbi:hypothetical protein GCM10008908_31340 [Clostridium subterminale]|uniref:Uncharacterized protein n=1 Tax=Clostridium subterminale TaxID=1550 RepID=A0ABP3W485_CLOSU